MRWAVKVRWATRMRWAVEIRWAARMRWAVIMPWAVILRWTAVTRWTFGMWWTAVMGLATLAMLKCRFHDLYSCCLRPLDDLRDAVLLIVPARIYGNLTWKVLLAFR